MSGPNRRSVSAGGTQRCVPSRYVLGADAGSSNSLIAGSTGRLYRVDGDRARDRLGGGACVVLVVRLGEIFDRDPGVMKDRGVQHALGSSSAMPSRAALTC